MANINAQQLETARRKQAQRIKTNTKRGLGDWEKERDVDVRGTDSHLQRQQRATQHLMERYGEAHAKTRRGGEALATKNEKKQQHEKKLVVVLVVVAAAGDWWTIWWRFAGKDDSKTP